MSTSTCEVEFPNMSKPTFLIPREIAHDLQMDIIYHVNFDKKDMHVTWKSIALNYLNDTNSHN